VKWASYEEWVEQVPESMSREPLWSFQVYPKALFLADLAWEDTEMTLHPASCILT
jgi:hypothetical protein